MSEFKTATGRRLADALQLLDQRQFAEAWTPDEAPRYGDAIRAIEEEARNAALAEAEEAIGRLDAARSRPLNKRLADAIERDHKRQTGLDWADRGGLTQWADRLAELVLDEGVKR